MLRRAMQELSAEGAWPQSQTVEPVLTEPRTSRRSQLPRRWLVAALAAGMAVGGVEMVDHLFRHVGDPTPPLLVGVVVAAFAGGGRAGLLTALLGLVWLPTYLGPVTRTGRGVDGNVVESLAVYVVASTAVAVLVGQLQRRAARRLASEREHAERVATLERVKSHFLNVASHELRGPIGVLRGYTSMIGEGAFGPVEAADLTRVAPVLSAKIDEMALLIDEMLDTARLEEHRLSLNLEPVDLRDVAQRAVDTVAPLASDRHRLLWTPPPRQVIVTGDKVRLSIIFTNLLQNAVKYSPDGGVVHCFLTAAGGNRAVFTVWDQGLGIAAADLPRLFTRFGRLVTRENSHIAGTGLGLFLARELTRLHGGDITVRSEHGRGSVFTVSLPLTGPPA